MTDVATYSALNELLINVSRSLLQYVGECWPWTDAKTAEERQKIEELVQQQKRQIGPLAAILQDADWTIDFGTYPTEYTDLHYVAIDYLLSQMISNQQGLIEDANRTISACDGHPHAKKLAGEIAAVQHTILQDLQTLAKTASAA